MKTLQERIKSVGKMLARGEIDGCTIIAMQNLINEWTKNQETEELLLEPECHCGCTDFTEDGVCMECPDDCSECA